MPIPLSHVTFIYPILNGFTSTNAIAGFQALLEDSRIRLQLSTGKVHYIPITNVAHYQEAPIDSPKKAGK
jgi:hypothetical protein